MDNDRVIAVLRIVSDTLQTDYPNQKECKKAIYNCLYEVNKLGCELTGKPIFIKSKTVIESLVTPNAQPTHIL